MTFIRRSDIVQVYHKIKRETLGQTCSVLILVAPTVDALCALRILTEILKCDFIPFKVVPVAGYDDIRSANDTFLQGQDELKSIFMIDCGAIIDLAEILSINSQTVIYVIDSHRPYVLTNIFNSQLMIIDDGFVEENLTDLQLAYEGQQILTEDKEEDENNDDDDDSDNDSDDEENNDEDDGNDDEENDSKAENTKANRLKHDTARLERRAAKEAKQKHRNMCIQKLQEYYRDGNWYGTSVARLFFDLSEDLSRGCNDFLWYSILGVTSQQLMELSGTAAYEAEISWLRERCLQLNKDTGELEGGNTMINRDGRIKYEPEFRFMLTRHWTLFNSMLHSRYMATKLGVWREKGRRMLETFIVKMGVPLAQCKVDFQSMELELKESLPLRISKYAGEFGLDDVSFPSFMREYGFVMRLSASDAVYALMALVETPYSTGDNNVLSDRPAVQNDSPIWVRNFYAAFDALGSQNVELMKKGIRLAMKQQQVILHEATIILSHKLLRYGRRFRYVILKNSIDITWLAKHSFSLAKLALFLADATRKSRRGDTPLLVSAFNSSTNSYLLVSTTPHEGDQIRNHFGRAFRKAVQLVNARVKHDGFDKSIIEVRSEDLKRFLQTLQTIPLQ